MVKTRQPPQVRGVSFAPRTRRTGLLECMALSELFGLAPAEHWAGVEILQFHLWVFFTAGQCRHLVDFTPFECTPGTVLHVRPGELHRWDPQPGLAGHALLVGLGALSRPLAPPSALIPAFEPDRWPTAIRMPSSALGRVAREVERLSACSRGDSSDAESEAIFWHLAMATLLEVRRCAQASAGAGSGGSPSPDETRLRAFHRLVERSFRETRAVASYAHELGCSVRTLERTTRAWEGATAKEVISARVLLEARRQLAHTDLSLEVLAEMLGFGEATQFAKFFRREAGETPGTFRRRYRGIARHTNPPADPGR